MAASSENIVLSDVHVFSPKQKCCQSNFEKQTSLSRFYFSLPAKLSNTHENDFSVQIINSGSRYKHQLLDRKLDKHEKNVDPSSKKRKVCKPFKDSPCPDYVEHEEGAGLSVSHLSNAKTQNVDVEETSASAAGGKLELDEDGDLIVTRTNCQFSSDNHCPKVSDFERSHPYENKPHIDSGLQVTSLEVLTIGVNVDLNYEYLISEHKMETFLKDVGFQLWAGALLLCDYLIYHRNTIFKENSSVLDLGAGLGVTSIVAAMFSSCVICTDYRSDILAQAESNWHRNRWLLPQVRCKDITFRVLDWTCDDDFNSDGQKVTNKYTLQREDHDTIRAVNMILGAEVIYDEELTDAFFKTIYHLLLHPPSKDVFITLEKRIVFTAKDLDVCSPAYEHFQENLADLVSVDEGPVRFSAEKMSSSFPQFFLYRRSKEMELWKISSRFEKVDSAPSQSLSAS